MDRIARLFDGYIEDDLSPEERAELCACLREDDESVDDFVRESYLHCQLFSIMRQKALQDDVMASPSVDGEELSPGSKPHSRQAASAANPRRHERRGIDFRMFLALAASVLAAAALLFWQSRPPRTVAQLQATAGARWDRGVNRTAGTLLHEGEELRIHKGRVLATMVSGARVVVEGPAVLRLTGENSVELESGKLGAAVPPQATGFAVHTAVGEVVDLGTEFTLDLASPSTFNLYVFAGLVEVRPRGTAADNPPFQVPQTRAVSYDAATGEAKLIDYGPEHKLSL
jgi:hypothetical protein